MSVSSGILILIPNLMNQDTAFRQSLQLVAQRMIDVFGNRQNALHQISKAALVSAITYYLVLVTLTATIHDTHSRNYSYAYAYRKLLMPFLAPCEISLALSNSSSWMWFMPVKLLVKRKLPTLLVLHTP